MASAASILAGVQVENVAFPLVAKPPGSSKTLFLGGAGIEKVIASIDSLFFLDFY